jgi:site-specific DNA-cytosine methylase
MKVLSLFDGISCARLALEKAGFEVDKYVASEIDRYAMEISKKNFPDIIQIGDVCDILKAPNHYPAQLFVGKWDLLIGGSPCQDLSIAKHERKGLKGSRSGLFYEYVRILKLLKPKYFILENVASMPKEAKDAITKELGVEPIMINAALVSAYMKKGIDYCPRGEKEYVPRTDGKTNTLTTGQAHERMIIDGSMLRKLHPVECERLQCLPDGYTEGQSFTQRYKACGNAFNVDVVAHILSFIKKHEQKERKNKKTLEKRSH